MIFKKLRFPILLLLILATFFGFKAVDNHFEVSKNLEIFASVYKEINTHYVDELKPGELMRTGVNAMLGSLDPYTNFYSEAQAEEAIMRHEGEYGGLGINVKKKGDYIVVASVSKEGPAAKQDLRIGDKFITINGVKMKGMSLSGIGLHLKGGVGTQLKIEIDRPGVGSIDKKIFREKIEVSNVPYYGMVNENVGYIKLNQFMSNASAQVIQAYNELKKNPKFNSLLLDLRNNGGGYLHESVNIVNMFVPQNELIVTTKGRRSQMYHEYRTRVSPLDLEIPLVVLINQSSASASEIVSGSLQDLDRAVIVGVNSFGKGLVQNTMPTKYRTQVKITTAKYYTPSGRCIQLKDYSSRNANGSAGIVADSLRESFKTKNGRVVKDGGGVMPDVVVEKEGHSAFVKQVMKENLFFDFANLYRNKNEKISSPKEFSLTEEELTIFLDFIKERKFKYSSKTAVQLEKLEKSSEVEQLDELIRIEFKALEKKLNLNIDELFTVNKKQIKEKLEKEITRRYYFEDALFEASFDEDKDIQRSIPILNSLEMRTKILTSL